jgi:7-keto-8-aminopelargonate synthetase-like enzyme
VAAQALAGEFSHALVDGRTHLALHEAADALNCPILRFKHRDPEDLARTLKRCGQGSRPIVLTDGMFSREGSVAPLRAYLRSLPRDGWLLVDDAHGAGILGNHGRGSLELEGVSRARAVQCVTLSKAFGVFGGAVLGPRSLREKIFARSGLFIGSTPLPLPLVCGAIAAVKVMKHSAALRERLHQNTAHVRSSLRKAGLMLPETPGPIIALPPLDAAKTRQLTHALSAANIFPSLLKYPGGAPEGNFRFVISSEHTRKQLDALIGVLALIADR